VKWKKMDGKGHKKGVSVGRLAGGLPGEGIGRETPKLDTHSNKQAKKGMEGDCFSIKFDNFIRD
jgi:hypothetical protein